MWGLRLQVESGRESDQVLVGVLEKPCVALASVCCPVRMDDHSLLMASQRDGKPLAVDLRPVLCSSEQWNIAVKHGALVLQDAGQVVLRWESLDRLPEDVEIKLLDTATGTCLSMRTTDHYAYQPSRGESARRFHLLAERSVSPWLEARRNGGVKHANGTQAKLGTRALNECPTGSGAYLSGPAR